MYDPEEYTYFEEDGEVLFTREQLEALEFFMAIDSEDEFWGIVEEQQDDLRSGLEWGTF